MKDNKGLLNKKRFEKAEQQKKQWLKNLSWKKALQLEENLISSELIWEWRRNFSKDNPVCLKISLSKKRKNNSTKFVVKNSQ
ncbi:MAG: hypothetical protein WAV28_10750 [Sedimentisphaerales bacterium]